MNKLILDTNCYAAYLTGDQEVLQALTEAKITFMSIFVLGELYAGFKDGTREKENRKTLRTFLKKSSVITLNASIETAELFGVVKDTLKGTLNRQADRSLSMTSGLPPTPLNTEQCWLPVTNIS